MLKRRALAAAPILTVLLGGPALAQTQPAQADPLIVAATDAAAYMRQMFATSAERMSEEDYAFRPTPEVRSFGQLLAHAADANYMFCAAARAEEAPVRGLEKTLTTRAEIQTALAESFAYCDGAYEGLDAARANAPVGFRGGERPVLAVLLFRTHHGMLHYGNVITYMRLRGKIPPSTEP